MYPILLIVILFVSNFINLHLYEFKGEEDLRLEVAYEMFHGGNYFQPTLFGHYYYNKPPFFNWLILLSSHLVGWNELTGRVVSLISLAILLVVCFIFSYRLYRNFFISALSALILISFGNVLFFYGYLGEIDITFTLFVFITIILLYLSVVEGKSYLLLFAGLWNGLTFLLKGLPAYAFYGLSLIVLSLYKRNLRLLLSVPAILSYILSVLLPTLWLMNTVNPLKYAAVLIHESIARLENEDKSSFISALLKTFKDLLPHSVLFFVSLYILRRHNNLSVPNKPLLLVLVVNSLPYLLSGNAGRYILPLYPLMAILMSYYVVKAFKLSQTFRKVFFWTILGVIILRILYGAFFFPIYDKKKSAAMEMMKVVGTSEVACDCIKLKALCVYVGIWKGKPLKAPDLSNWDYLITCKPVQGLRTLKHYNFGNDKEVWLQAR
ncbi:ArnT family glycosyltransferase [Thermocrinis minervae]|uniref:4-amino-4-deoxy-L-arabinose transferase n=1 Tax=Thermocrinis minervae TaxID=381751 RepID=A0A1M6RF39_9AQUI|nr:glycosyltransferase family 39 protein [Thermocrinis minervae]SHK31094.1 4-amino-4-deoxy-L-arabinose transferase [Thermocrinis minervae]